MADPLNQQSLEGDADKILAVLVQRQYLRPHQTVTDVFADLKLCPVAVEQAIRWLGLDASRPIGRLRASQLGQLARCIQRLWDQGRANAQRSPQAV